MAGDSVTINKNMIGVLLGVIAIVTFGWNIAKDYTNRGAKIDRLEYQISLQEVKDKEILEKYDRLLTALNKQEVEFARLRAVIKQRQ